MTSLGHNELTTFEAILHKNTLETCKNPRPTSRWSELTKSCATSTMNFHIAYFSWIPQNARLKLSCKFDESKCNPYWYITLTTSHGMNHVLNEHLDFSQHDPHQCPYAITSVIVIQLIWKFQESNWNPDWFIALMNSFDTNHIFNNNKNLGQYDQNPIPSKIRPCYSYPASLTNQNEIRELTC